MSAPPDRDPPRWRELPPSAPGLDGELAAASRSVAAHDSADELRVAHMRQRALQRAAALAAPGQRRHGQRGRGVGWGWARTAAIVLISLLVGGVAAAVTGRLMQRYRAARTLPAVAPAVVSGKPGEPRPRRWRLSVKTPTDLDVSVGPDGAEIAVVEGQARMSGEGIAGALEVVPGQSWREAATPAEAAASSRPGSQGPRPVPSVPAGPTVTPAAPAPRATVALAEPRRSSRSDETGPRSRPLPPPALPAPIVIPAPSPSLVEPPPVAVPPIPIHLPSPQASPPEAPAERPRPPAPPVIGEATLLARALGRLRRDHDPLWALNDLDEHRRRFPRGELQREAALARAEALLAMDRKTEALAMLDGMRLDGGATARSAMLARAELRADEGRRMEALGDFDRVIAGAGDDTLADRAWFGRGLCHLRGGDLDGARADLRTHRDRFPSSARRAQVDKLLERLDGN